MSFTPREIQEFADRILVGDTTVWSDIPSDLHKSLIQSIHELSTTGRSETAEELWKIDRTEKPVGIDEFIDSDDYLGFGGSFWEPWREELRYVLDPQNEIYEWIIEGGIRAGKTTAGLIALLYKIYLLTTFHAPQDFYGLIPDTKIGIALFDIHKKNVDDGSYYNIQRYMQRSPYFRSITTPRHNSSYVDLPKSIVFALGSMAIHSLGRAIFSGMLDEANIPRAEGRSIQAQYVEIRERIDTQFMHRVAPIPLLVLASQPKSQEAFLSQHRQKYGNDPHTHVTCFATWEAREHQYRNSKRFYVLVGNDRQESSMHRELPEHVPSGMRIITPPVELWDTFYRNLNEAIRDLGGIPTFGVNPFIQQRDLIDAMVSDDLVHPFRQEEVMVGHRDLGNALIDNFKRELMFDLIDKTRDIWRVRKYPNSSRFIHVDLAKGRQDAAGMSCVCLGDLMNVEREDKDGHIYTTQDYLIHTDFTVRIVNREFEEIGFGQIVDFISYLYSAGLPIAFVSYDRYQSTHSIQELDRRGFDSGEQSVDISMVPYEVLRQVILERRIKCYRHTRLLEELKKLVVVPHKTKEKVDHPEGGGKDTADSLCGSVFKLLSDKRSIPRIDPSVVRLYDKDTEETRSKPEYHIFTDIKDYDRDLLNPDWKQKQLSRKPIFSRKRKPDG